MEEAEAEVVAATEAVDAAQLRIDLLGLATDDLVVEAYVNPPANTGLDAFREAQSLSDVAVRQALVEIQADSDADLLDQLEQAHEDLEVEKANKEALAAEAEAKRVEAEGALTELQNALAQQQSFAADLEARLNAKLAEAESLKAFDAALADQLVREQAALAELVRKVQENEERERQAAARGRGGRRGSGRVPRLGGRRLAVAAVAVAAAAGAASRTWRPRSSRRRPGAGHRDLPVRRVDHGRGRHRGQRAGSAQPRRRPGRVPVRQQRVAQPGRADRPAPRPLRHVELRDLPDAVVPL